MLLDFGVSIVLLLFIIGLGGKVCDDVVSGCTVSVCGISVFWVGFAIFGV